MIVLDTNVLSEIMKPKPEPLVFEWVESLPTRETATTAITVAEIRYGIARMPVGVRRQKLVVAADAIFDHDFQDRILSFDADSAVEYAEFTRAHWPPGTPGTSRAPESGS